MESRAIYESDKTNIQKIEWLKLDDSEWKYLDAQPAEKNIKDIVKYLKDSKLYLVTNQNESKEIENAQLGNVLRNLHGQKDFKIWTRNFRYVVELNKVGIYRKGEKMPNGIEYFFAKVLKALLR